MFRPGTSFLKSAVERCNAPGGIAVLKANLGTFPVPKQRLEEESRPKLVSDKELSHFHSVLPQVLQDLVKVRRMEMLPDTNLWLVQMLSEILPKGESLRAKQMISANSYLNQGKRVQNSGLVAIVAWCYEMGHRSFSMLDDMMENLRVKGSRPTWHARDNHGLAAVSDGLVISSSAAMVQEKHLGDKPYYKELIDLRNFTTHTLLYGRSRGLRAARQRAFNSYDMKFYTQMKTMIDGHSGMYGPVSVVMIMNGLQAPKLMDQIKSLSGEIGVFHGAKSDMYGSEDHPEKFEADITNGNCTWQFAKAREVASNEQWERLLRNYGSSERDRAEEVKAVYREVGVEELYQAWADGKVERIRALVDALPKEGLQGYYRNFMASTYGRII